MFNKVKKKILSSNMLFKGKNKKVKIGLALGGGGARGFAHLGAIKAFEEYGLKFDYIAGTSAGSIVGAFYALGWDSYDMEKAVLGLDVKDIKKSKFPLFASSTETLQNTINRLMGEEKVFSDLKKKFVAVAVNVKTGREVRIESGSVAKACAASASVPAVFKPVDWGDKTLIDGGVLNVVPADIPRELGCDYVIAVDVNKTRGEGTEVIKTLNILSSSLGILMKTNVLASLEQADVVIKPNLKEFSSSKLDGAGEMIIEGERATMAMKEEIIKTLKKKSLKKERKWPIKDLEYI